MKRESGGSKENRDDGNENIRGFYFELDSKIMSQKHACELFRRLTVIVPNPGDSLKDVNYTLTLALTHRNKAENPTLWSFN